MSIKLSSAYTQVSLNWADYKTTHAAKSLVSQYDDDGKFYTIYGYDGPNVYVCKIWKGTLPDSVIASGYTQELNDSNKSDFETSYKTGFNKSLVQRTADGKNITAFWPTEGDKPTDMSHNWCDPTTWYTEAVRVVDEVAEANLLRTEYALDHQNVIDTYHGKLSQEDFLVDANGNSFRVVVKVNDVTKTEQNPHTGSGGDYTVDYDAGKILFLSAQSVGAEVKVTYHYENGSAWYLKPAAGKILKIHRVEAQFSADIDLTDTIKFQAYVAGQPYGNPTVYKTMMDFINEANGVYPVIPALGGSSWRGTPHSIYQFPWNYQSLTKLKSSYAMQIKLFLEHDTPYGGWGATAAFYCLSETE